MANRYVAFLRAINVGGHVVKMAALRREFESLGLESVETFIASGNVIFDSSARNAKSLETKIATHLGKSLGYEVATFLRTTSEVASVADFQPFPDADGARLYVGFLADPLGAAGQRAVMGFSSEADDFHVRGREIYWSCRIPSAESEFSLARLERAINAKATFRNVTTVRKLAAKYSGR